MKADALVGLITGPHAEGRAVGAEVTVLIDLDTLRNGLHPDSVCETGDGQPLPPESVRRLCCDAEIIPAVLGGGGELLDVGRSQRVANRAQRRALRAMYRSCAHPDCTVRFADCDIHHAVEWSALGATDLINLTATLFQAPSHGPRRRLDTGAARRPQHHPAPTRRHHPLPRSTIDVTPAASDDEDSATVRPHPPPGRITAA